MNGADVFRGWVSRWWRGEAGLPGIVATTVTLPFEVLFRGASRARNEVYDRRLVSVHRAGVPIVCVGNLTIGGTGKTPIAAWVARSLGEMGRSPWVLLRGYGADEVQVHRELNPGVGLAVGADRAVKAAEAIAAGADCLVLDDGFQHRGLHRDLDIVLLAAEQWRGPHRVLPRGPWRETGRSLRRAGFILVTRKAASRSEGERVLAAARRTAPDVPSGMVHLELSDFLPLEGGGKAGVLDRGQRVIALSSLGNPGAFEEQLREKGVVVSPMRFPDHHEFSSADVISILRRAAGNPIVVTRKEAVKLRGKLPPEARVLVADQRLVFEQGHAELKDVIRRAVTVQ